MTNRLELRTDRFLLRSLTTDDISDRYLSWFSDPYSQMYIVTAKKMQELQELKCYVAQKASDPHVFFWGIFEIESGQHIGNLKFELLPPEYVTCDFGILIGEPNFRGKGVAAEVMRRGIEHLRTIGITRIYLGVKKSNVAAVAVYSKLGFRADPSNRLGSDVKTGMCMYLDLV